MKLYPLDRALLTLVFILIFHGATITALNLTVPGDAGPCRYLSDNLEVYIENDLNHIADIFGIRLNADVVRITKSRPVLKDETGNNVHGYTGKMRWETWDSHRYLHVTVDLWGTKVSFPWESTVMLPMEYTWFDDDYFLRERIPGEYEWGELVDTNTTLLNTAD